MDAPASDALVPDALAAPAQAPDAPVPATAPAVSAPTPTPTAPDGRPAVMPDGPAKQTSDGKAIEPAPSLAPTRITLKMVKANPKARKLIEGANEVMKAMGYTEHGQRHVGVVASITRYILDGLDIPPREVELGQIAAYLHDIGNVISRVGHPMHGANLAYVLLDEMGMDAGEIAPILGAIGNHEELTGMPVSAMSAAVIIADKSDVHFSRVQNPLPETFDIHDRVNFAVQRSRVELDPETRTLALNLEIDTDRASVMDYFEIFLSRMIMCRKACETLGTTFALRVNGTVLD